MKDFIDLLHKIREQNAEEVKDMTLEEQANFENAVLERYLNENGLADRIISEPQRSDMVATKAVD